MYFGGMVGHVCARLRALALGALIACIVLVSAAGARAAGPFPITERFDSASWGQFNHAGTAQLTAAEGIDGDGEGWLRLNDNSYQLGYVWSDESFPSSEGWTVEFEYAMWGSYYEEPADGISFFLFDASVPQFQIGAGGGGLGYSGDAFGGEDTDGVPGGVLGVGLDAWGNFSHNYGEPLIRGQVAVRGPQSTGYRLLAAHRVEGGLLTFSQPYVWDPAVGRARAVRVRISSPDNRHVTVQLRRPGGPWETALVDVEIPGVLPERLKVGFAGTSGSYGMITEVRRFGTTLPLDYAVTVDDGAETGRRGEPRTWTVEVANHGQATPSAPVGLTLESGQGLEDVAWSCRTAGGASCGAGSGWTALADRGVPAGEALTFSVAGRPSASAEFAELTATARNTDPALSDIDAANDSATDRTDLRSAAPNARAGDDQVVAEGTLVTLDASASTDPDGDPMSFSWKLVEGEGPAPVLTAQSGARTQFEALDDGEWTFRLTADDGSGDPATDEVTVRATNRTPTIGSAELAGQQGGASVLSATVADDGALDRHSATVDWGDGSAAEAATVTPGAGWAAVIAAHRYAAAGSYQARLTISDGDGGTVTRTLSLTAARPTSIWANATSDPFLGFAFSWLGLGGRLSGTVHSNASLKIGGLGNTVDGAIEYVKSYWRLGLGITVPTATKVAASSPPPGLAVTDFRPGGPVASELGGKYHDMSSSCRFGVWSIVTPADLVDGVYYAPCNVTVSALHARGKVTLVSTGKIFFLGDDSDFSAYYKGVLALSSRTGGDAIEVLGAGDRLAGVLDGRGGDVELTGAGLRLSCGVIGNQVSITGADVRVDGGDCAPPAATVASTQVVPQLSAGLSVDREAATPGDTLRYSASVTNSRADVFITGIVGVQNPGTAAARVDGSTYELQYQGTDKQWRTVASSADAREPVGISTSAMASPGVTYGSGGPAGTSVSAGALAAWGYQARVRLSPDTAKLLWDPTRALAVRSVLKLTLSGDSHARELSTLGEDITAQLRAKNADITNARLYVAAPSGDGRVFSPADTPALARLAPGQTQHVTVDHTLAPVSPRAAQESISAYAKRLRAVNGSQARGSVYARGSAATLSLTAIQHRTSTERRIPIIELGVNGPDALQTAATAAYAVRLTNSGSASASGMQLASTATGGATATLGGAPVQVPAGASASATSTLAAPAAAGAVRHAATATWRDANGNAYGDVEAAKNIAVRAPAALRVIKRVEVLEDADGNGRASAGDTVEYEILVENTGGSPLTSVQVTDPVPTGLDLLAASLSTSQGTVGAVDGRTVEAQLGTISGTASVIVRFRALVRPLTVRATVENQAIVTSEQLAPVRSDDPDLPGIDDPTALAVTPSAPILSVNGRAEVLVDRDSDGVASPGDTLRMRFVAQNDGDRAATGVVLRAPVGAYQVLQAGSVSATAGTASSDGGVPSLSIASLGLAARVTLAYDVRVDSAVPDDVVQLLNGAEVASNELAVSGPAPLVTPLNITPRLKVTKSWLLAEDRDGNAAVSTGDILAYSVAVKNPTPAASAGTVVEDRLDSATTLVAGSLALTQGTTSANGPVITGSIGSLAGGATAALTYRVLVGALAPGDYELSGQASATSPSLGTASSDDPASEGAADPTSVPVVATPAAPPSLSSTKRSWVSVDADGDGKASPGDTLSYEVTITNSGAGGASGVVATDKIDPAGSLLIGSVQAPATATVLQGNTAGDAQVKVDIGSIAAGASATFSYQVTINPLPAGTQTVTSTGTVASNEVAPVPTGSVQGTTTPVQAPQLAAPTIRIVEPLDGATVTQRAVVAADLIAPAGQAIAEWCVYAQRVGEPDASRRTVRCGTGAPAGRDLATFDPTVLPNGAYTLTVDATADGGGAGYASVTVIVSGALKPGRYAVTYTDMDLPIGTLPIRVTRSYDSFDKTNGDFGVGWRVGLDGFRVAVNRPLGQGGWVSEPSDCMVLLGERLCTSTDFSDLRSHAVTVTWPDGRAETFDFTPSAQTGSVVLGGTAGFTGRKGATSKLRVAADQAVTFLADGNLYEADQETVYNPTRFELTAADNTRYLLDVSTGLVSSTDPHGNTLTVDETGVHSSLGAEVLFTRDGQGRITRIDGPSGERRTYGYSTAGDLASVTDALGNTASHEYDADHNLTRTIDPSGRPTRTIQYDADGRIAQITDAAGNSVDLDISADARTQTVTSPDGRLTTVTSSDERGNPTRVDKIADGQTRTTRFEYDENDNQTKVTDPLGHSTTTTFDDAGNRLSTTDPLGNTTRYEYDANNRLLKTTTADGKATTLTRDQFGSVTKVTDPLGHEQTFTYDQAGNRTAETDALGRVLRASFDASGNAISVTDSSGAVSLATYDASGNLASVSAPGIGTSALEYDAEGQLTAVIDSAGNATRYSYDALGRRTHVADQLGRLTVTAYNAMGLETQVTDREGQLTSLAYDEQGRLREKVANGTQTTYLRDGFGRLRSAENADAKISLQYDAADRPTSFETTLAGAGTTSTVAYAYDAADRRVSLAYGGVTDRYSYDEAGRLTRLASSQAGAFLFGYDDAGRRTSIQRPNGLATSYSYNEADQVTAITHAKGSETLDQSRYAYNSGGRRVRASQYDGDHLYSYDTAGRLTGTDNPAGQPNESFSYDLLGNRTGDGEQYDAANRMRSRAGYAYSSDREGRITSRVATNGETTRFTWDAQNRLRSVGLPSGSVTQFLYDPLGRRIATSREGATRFQIYGLDANAVAETNNGVTTRYTFGLDLDTPLAMSTGGTTSYFEQDALGSVTSVSNVSGVVAGRYSYSAYGQITAHTGADSPYTFAGREYDPESGLYQFRARWYEPAAGRFLSEDPVEAPQRYGYAAANPVSLRDPTGMWTLGEESQTSAIESDAEAQSSAPSVQTARTAQQLKKEEEAFSKLDPNKYRHIFEKAEHKFDDVVEELGGREAVMRTLIKGVTQLGITAGRYEAYLVIMGRTVAVRGAVVDGVVRIGTAFVV